LRNGLDRLVQKARFGGLFVLLALLAAQAFAQDYEREKRWADSIVKTLMIGSAEWLQQKKRPPLPRALYRGRKAARRAIIAHGRGWSPDFELYGTLRTRLAELGYTTLSIQLPVLPSTAILGLYVPLYPDARERFQLAVDFLKAKGHRNIAIVSHSLGATMANQYLIRTDDTSVRAWVFIGILQGLEEAFPHQDPDPRCFWQQRLDRDDVGRARAQGATRAHPRLRPDRGAGAKHFFEDKEEELLKIVVAFLDKSFGARTCR
jgi:acetyl esterase/lipase